MISVGDTEKFAELSHLQCLYPSFNVCCYGPLFTCIQKYGHGQGTHQSDLGADGDVLLSFQMTFSLVSAAVVWAILDSTSGLDPSSDTLTPRYFKLRAVASFLLSMSYVSADAIGVICHQLGFSACHMLWRPLQGDLPI